MVSHNGWRRFLLLLLCGWLVQPVLVNPARAEPATVRVALLKFGTVNWEMASMQHHGLDRANGIQVQITPYASADATMVALLSRSADVVVDDWLLVSRQRQSGRQLSFLPYSTAVGSLMVPPGSPVHSLADLAGLRVGVAGGPLDKNWLLLQGLASDQHGLNLSAANTIVFGAPPLLMHQVRRGEIDAVLNYWHYSARLESLGFRRISSSQDAAVALGASGLVSAIGYVFHEQWARANPAQINGFIAASRSTKRLLNQSDAEWDRLARAGVIRDSGAALAMLRDRYRAGIPRRPVNEEESDAAMLFRRLASLGGRRLVGDGETLSPGTFWRAGR